MTTTNVNITKVLLKRGNTAQNNNYTGVFGEITIDTQLKTLRVHDGVTAGGNAITASGAIGSYSNTNTAAYLTSQSITSANIGAFQTFANANAAAQATSINSINANVGAYQTFANSNAATQTTEINSLRANITAANAAITALQSNAAIQQAILDTLTSNAATQSTVLDTLTSNAAAQATSLTTLLSNAVAQQTSLIDLVANAAVQAQAIANVSGTYSNTNVSAYLTSVAGNILPAANVTYSLGSEQYQWRDLWVSNNTIYIGNTPIRVDGGTLLVNNSPITAGSTYGNANVASYLPTYTGNIAGNIVTAVDSNLTVVTSQTLTTNNSYTNTTDFSTDVDPGVGYAIAGWYQRNSEQIEFALFGPSAFQTYLTGLALGRTVIVTYSTGSGNQTLTRTLTQRFSETGQTDPANPTWGRVSGRIDATLPADQTGIVSINFPEYSVASSNWMFSQNGNLRLPTTGMITYANGVNILSTITDGGTYSNSNVASYLPTYSGNIGGNISFANGNLNLGGVQTPFNQAGTIVNVKGIVGMTASSGANISGFSFISAGTIRADRYQYSNGVSILDGISGTYGNTQVATYLSRGNVTVGNITIKDEYDQQWRFSNGALIWPAGDGTPTGPSIDGSSNMLVTLMQGGDFEIYTTQDITGNTRSWSFNSVGNLIVPDDATIWSDLDLRLYAEAGNIALGNQNGTWQFDNDGKLTAPGEVYGQFFTLRGGNGPGAEIGSLGYGGNVVTVHGYEGFNIETGPVESGPQWQFGTGGRLSLGANIGAIYADQTTGIVSIGDSLGPEGEPTAPSTVIAIGGTDNAFTISRYSMPYGQYWEFRANGETVFPQHGNVTISGNLTVGNLVVNGNSTVINTESYVVEDNIIQMANANPADTLDLGFVAHRTVDGNLQHTGLIRDASAGNWRLFSNVVSQPGNTVDFTNAVYDSLIIGGLGTTSISLTGPLNFTASPPAYSTPGIQWASGWQGDIYGNTQVATYLQTYTGNVSATNYLFANGVNILSSVTATANTGNITFSDTTIGTAGGAGQGIILNSAGSGEIAMLDYVGINNSNPGYWLHVGDGSIGAVNNTGNISIDYNNGLDSSRGSTILGYAWWDTGGNGNNNRGIGAHRQFGIYRNDDLYTTKYIEFDLTSGNANLTNIAVTRVTTTNGVYWANGASILDGITGGGGTTYTDANVVSMLAANSAVFVGNVNNVNGFSLQSNITQVFIGGNTVIASGNANVTNSTTFLHNMYFAANGTRLVRNTGAGVGLLSFDPTGFTVSGLITVQTANTAPALPHWIKANTNGLFAPSGFTTSTITASGTVAANGTNGIQTSQTTFPLVNQTATTILFGGAATTISMGSSTIGGTGSNVFVGNAIGTSTGNLTLRAFGTYNSVNSLTSSGGYGIATYSNIAVTGGSGTGMIISMSGVASGYLGSATVTNPGTGYRNGDTITIPAGNPVGSLGGSFVLGNYNAAFSGTGNGLANYTFGIDGNLTLPGNLSLPNSARITYANGANVLYGNTQADAFLSSGPVSNITMATGGNISGVGNIIGATSNTTITAGSYTTSFLSNGVMITSNVIQTASYYETYSNISNTGGNITFNFANSSVFYATLTANVTANIVGIANSLSTVTGFTVIIDQGATPYRIANIQFNGGTVTNIKWAGTTVPTGTASNTDIVSISLINLGNGTYRVLGQQSSYG